MQKLLNEPFVHFLLIGTGLFLSYGLMNDGSSGSEGRIVVSAGRIEQLANVFVKTRQRAPTRQELDGLIQEFVLEEAYYRRAVDMGLDRDDTIIRRRMRQKLEFLTYDTASLFQPTDEELATYLAKHQDAFRESAVYTFEQAYYDPEGHAANQLSALRAGKREVADVTLLPTSFKSATSRIVDSNFGAGFSGELDKLEVGEWQGPVRSGLGFHLIRLESRAPGQLPELEKIRPIVEREWSNERRLAVRDEANAAVLDGYEVVVQWPQFDADEEPVSEASAR